MGQYWKPVNLDKKEYIHPHKLGSGLKLCEQIYCTPGTQAALIILLAAMPERRGGGDLDLVENFNGPERKDFTKVGEMPEAYPQIAKRTIGRWAGDRIALIGDYADDSDLTNSTTPASIIYSLCIDPSDLDPQDKDAPKIHELFRDITDDVCKVIEHELCGKFEGDGWRKFTKDS